MEQSKTKPYKFANKFNFEIKMFHIQMDLIKGDAKNWGLPQPLFKFCILNLTLASRFSKNGVRISTERRGNHRYVFISKE